jgi:hypothetical protein
VLAPTFRHREQWQVPIIVGATESSNAISPQQQLPRIIVSSSWCARDVRSSIGTDLAAHTFSVKAARKSSWGRRVGFRIGAEFTPLVSLIAERAFGFGNDPFSRSSHLESAAVTPQSLSDPS